jgi:hypothetical protein
VEYPGWRCLVISFNIMAMFISPLPAGGFLQAIIPK